MNYVIFGLSVITALVAMLGTVFFIVGRERSFCPLCGGKALPDAWNRPSCESCSWHE